MFSFFRLLERFQNFGNSPPFFIPIRGVVAGYCVVRSRTQINRS
jgi:hypothetical protein